MNCRLLMWQGPAWLCSQEWFIMRNGLSALQAHSTINVLSAETQRSGERQREISCEWESEDMGSGGHRKCGFRNKTRM